jgi:hypothetical protein
MKKPLKTSDKTKIERATIEIVPDDSLEHVIGGRNYGWECGGWISSVVDPNLPPQTQAP